jgi:hypothetical protein
MMSRRRNFVCHAAAVVTAFGVTYFLFQLFDRNPVVELDAAKSYITPNPAVPGGNVNIVWSAVEKRNCAGRVIPRVIDSAGRVFEYAYTPTVYHDLMRRDVRSFSKAFTLPIGMAPGRAQYAPIVTRWCNPVQQYIWPMQEAPFPIWFDVAAEAKN